MMSERIGMATNISRPEDIIKLAYKNAEQEAPEDSLTPIQSDIAAINSMRAEDLLVTDRVPDKPARSDLQEVLYETIEELLDDDGDMLEEFCYVILGHLEGMVPEKHCTCHIMPPCSDCVDHSYTRELIRKFEKALNNRCKKPLSSEYDDVVI